MRWILALLLPISLLACRAEQHPPPPTPADLAPAPEPTPAAQPEAEPEPEPEPARAVALAQARVWLRAGQRPQAIAGLRQGLQEGLYANKRDQQAAWYLLGRSLVQEGQHQEALEWLHKLPAPWSDAEDRRLLWLARGHLGAGQRQEAADVFARYLKKWSRQDEAGRATLQYAQVLHELGRPGEALQALARIKTDSREQRAQALWMQIQWLRQDKPQEARKLSGTLLLTLPETEAAQRDDLPLRLEELPQEQRWSRALRLNERWAYTEARGELRRFLDHPRYGDRAAWEVAYISLRRLRDDPEEARTLLRRVIQKDNEHREEAYYLLMRSFMKQERYQEALQVADTYDKLYPRGQYAERTAYYRGWLPYDRGQCKEALPWLKAYMGKHKAKRSIVAGFYAWCFIRLERWEDAIDAFGRLIPMGNPVVRGKAHYWRAWAMSRLERKQDALKELATLHRAYPLTYYDLLGQQLAARLEGRDPRASALPWPEGGGDAHLRHPMPQDAWDLPRLKGKQASALAQVRRLVELDELTQARELYRPLRQAAQRAVPDHKRLDFLRFMGHQVEDYRHGWQEVTGGSLAAMTRGLPDLDDVRWTLAYPRAYAPLVEALAQEFGPPPHFVYAIMRQESRYNPAAVSHTNAVGALQMIPPTARKVAAEMGLDYNPETFPQPQISFRYSFFYLKKHMEVFQSQLVPTAAAYNGGPEPIARWMRAQQGAGLDHLVEEFAYNESRIYCRKVAEHTLRYLYLYEPDPQARGRWLDALFPTPVDYTLPPEIDY